MHEVLYFGASVCLGIWLISLVLHVIGGAAAAVGKAIGKEPTSAENEGA